MGHEYLMTCGEDDGDTTERGADDLKNVIYPYLAALRALIDAGVEHAEKYIVELRTEEVGCWLSQYFYAYALV